ncbi:MAG: hypothetical protein ACI8XB_001776 [Patiriisocius sp.]|jgi:hypothetical protein
MRIIGTFLKKTNGLVYRRVQKKGEKKREWTDDLINLLKTAQRTTFGGRHNFANILKSEDLIKSFQINVPLTDYDEFYNKWLKDGMLGLKDHTWPGRIRHYALSSGTTGSPSKRIPITNQMIRSFQKSSISQLAMLHELNLSSKFYGGHLLAVGGSSRLTKKRQYLEGDLSGILKKYSSFLVTPLTKPGNKITKESRWKVKLEMMVLKAPEWNISIIAGVPSWCILLMEKIVDHYSLKNIHEMWPNLEVYVHGGVFIQPYTSRLEKIFGKKVILLDTYLASEGYFAYQHTTSGKGMKLLLNAGVFYEFVPFNSNYFDENGSLKDDYLALTLNEVMPSVNYALVVTTNAGLWRYMIGDLVQFTNVEQREIILTGRIKQYLSLCGEHLSLDNINQALSFVSKKLKIEFTEFTIYVNEENMNHHWFLGTNSEVDTEKIIAEIDQKLFEINDDYKCARSINLQNPVLTVLPVEKFYLFLESKGKLGAQIKFPRVLNKEQSIEWLAFIETL